MVLELILRIVTQTVVNYDFWWVWSHRGFRGWLKQRFDHSSCSSLCSAKRWDGRTSLLGNNKACKVIGIGSIRIRMFDLFERVLQEVSYVPQLKRNLISLVMLDQSGCTFKVENQWNFEIFKRAFARHERNKKKGLHSLIGETAVVKVDPVMKNELNKTKL